MMCYIIPRTLLCFLVYHTRVRPKVVFPLTAISESNTVSGQSVSAVTETTPKFIAYGRNRKWTLHPVATIVNQTTIHRHTTHTQWKHCALLTSVSNLVKKTPNRDCRHLSISHGICARLHTTCNDPTETLQLNECPVTDGQWLYSNAACVTWNNWTSYRQIWRRTRETLRGRWSR